MHQRDNKLQKKAVDYTLDKLNPYSQYCWTGIGSFINKSNPKKKVWDRQKEKEQANSVKRLSAVPEAIGVWKDALSGPTMKKE